ncbi:DUF4142 domain-containing protein (plasmid) [Paraburkholderia acidicola]|uniref:DUF4142 domain-containing protein n=1 Tax=Paraburkholderia acidicola TaxID=1912599 RepID=A0ABV1M023_9BURK
MKTTLTLAAAAACALQSLLFVPPANAQTEAASSTATNSLPDADGKFVQAASMAGSTEIDAAKLTMHQSDDKDVKSFARHMIMDHTKLALQLKKAAPRSVTVSKDNPDTQLLDSLKPLKGTNFDAAYVQKVGVQGHKDAIAVFQDEIENGQNANLKKMAQKALPTIEQHYKMAQELAQKKHLAAAQ